MFWRFLDRLPSPWWSVICIAAVLYLTLVPDPLGDNDLPLFPGADKVVHGVMMFGVVVCVIFDRLRSQRRYEKPAPPQAAVWGAVAAVVAFGGVIELAQGAMGLGRGEDWLDFAADAAGAVAGGVAAILLYQPVRRALLQGQAPE